ncbi:hypothetical protein [Chromobacterium haemolyticum]|uniref:hypothetical protein n=1 Tax=Chromobacterium haemolyticum TaxID=394935 RepID=UPI0009D94F89|nr:hypothetical protein [Chromobacterium haemolyticum]OQS34283.1 hypothetical protein B0T40_15685 [Chromobacterium haemolyticum]PTU71471.1 hypothetical protein DBB33_19450 [Chromobacterium haemolyticum]
MEFLALWIGYVVMVVGGVAILAALVIWLYFFGCRQDQKCLDLRDIQEAIREWKKAHPEKWDAYRKRRNIG